MAQLEKEARLMVRLAQIMGGTIIAATIAIGCCVSAAEPTD